MPVAQAGCISLGTAGRRVAAAGRRDGFGAQDCVEPCALVLLPRKGQHLPRTPGETGAAATSRRLRRGVPATGRHRRPDVRRGCADRTRAYDQAVSPARQRDHREEVAVGGRGRDTGGTADRAITGGQGQGSRHRPSINLLVHIKQALLHQPPLYIHAQLIRTRMSGTGVAEMGTTGPDDHHLDDRAGALGSVGIGLQAG